MVKKSFTSKTVIKGNTGFVENKVNGQRDRFPNESPLKILQCLNCTKPAKECKGNCFGRY